MSVSFVQILSLLRDSAAGVIIGAIIPIIISIIENRKRRRELSYEIISDKEDQQNGLLIRIIALKLWNSGNEIIKTDHFYNPVTFTFGNDALIKNTCEEDKKPTSIRLNFHTYTNKVELEPFNLKCKETFILAFSLQKAQNISTQDISIHVRGDIEPLDVATTRAKMRTTVNKLYGAAAFFIAIWIVFLMLKHVYITIQIFSSIAIISAVIVGLLLAMAILINMRRYQLLPE